MAYIAGFLLGIALFVKVFELLFRGIHNRVRKIDSELRPTRDVNENPYSHLPDPPVRRF